MPRNPDVTVAPFLVERAKLPPGKCVVSGDIDGPFVDMGVKYENRGYFQRLYIHAPVIEQTARDLLRMVPLAEHEALKDEKAAVEDELEALQLAFDALHGAKQEVAA